MSEFDILICEGNNQKNRRIRGVTAGYTVICISYWGLIYACLLYGVYLMRLYRIWSVGERFFCVSEFDILICEGHKQKNRRVRGVTAGYTVI